MHYWGEITSLIPADIILAGCDDKNSDFLIIFLYLVTKKHQLQFDDYDWKLQRAKEKVKWHSSLMDLLIEFLLAGKMLDGGCTCLLK